MVLVSGNGSNLQALLDASKIPENAYHIAAVIANRATAYGLQRAAEAGVPQHYLLPSDYPDRTAYDQALQHCIDQYQPQWVALAGFMRILSPEFVRHYYGRLLNIHPSLLPNYKGLNTHQRAIDANDSVHGASVHFVSEDLDSGPCILQAQVAVHPEDSAATLAARVLQQEHLIYPLAVQWCASGRLKLDKQQIYLDEQPLNAPIIYQKISNG